MDVWNGYFGLSNTNVDHGMTSLTTTNLYGYFGPIGNLTNGGLEIGALSDTDATAFKLLGVIGSTDPTDTTPAIVLQGAKKSGTGQGALSAAETVLKIQNNTTDLVTILGGGNVGIGTTSPASVLNVYSASGNSGSIEALDSAYSSGGYSAYRDLTGAAAVRGYVGFGPTLFGTGDNTVFGLRSQGTITFATNGGTRQMTIDTSGNVGIGTTGPGGDTPCS